MQKYVALLRGINVGGNNKVPMKELKKIFEDLGFSNVLTYINSGNVIFETNKKVAVKSIEKALQVALGFEVRVLVKEAKTLFKIVKEMPQEWVNDSEQKTDVIFLWDEFASKKTIDLIKTTEVDTLQYIDGAIVWNVKKVNYKKSGMKSFIGTLVYKNMTARNSNTVRKLAELAR
jgi:uncharacterized protein (DUF1697 family)